MKTFDNVYFIEKGEIYNAMCVCVLVDGAYFDVEKEKNVRHRYFVSRHFGSYFNDRVMVVTRARNIALVGVLRDLYYGLKWLALI